MRKLRLVQDEPIVSQETEKFAGTKRKLTLPDEEIREKVDTFFRLQQRLDQVNAKYKKDLGDTKVQLDKLKQELLAYGKEHEMRMVSGNNATAEFTGRVARSIDPKKFLTFLSEHNRTKEFYDFAEVPITKTVKHFGEAVLQASDVLTVSLNDYSGVNVYAR